MSIVSGLEVLSNAICKDKEVTSVRTARKELQLSLIAINVIRYIENPSDSTELTRDPLLEFSKLVGYKIGLQMSTAFLYTRNN